MQNSASDRVHHVRYMRRIIKLIKNIDNDNDILYIITQLSHLNNDRLLERVRRYLIKQNRDPSTGRLRKNGRGPKRKKPRGKRPKKKHCKCKNNRFQEVIYDHDLEYDDDVYDEKDEAVEIALINELIESSLTDGRFPTTVLAQQTPSRVTNFNQLTNAYVPDHSTGNLQPGSSTQQFYVDNYPSNESLQQQPITYNQGLINDSMSSVQQPTIKIDNISTQQKPLVSDYLDTSPSNYQPGQLTNSQSTQFTDTTPYTIIVEGTPPPINTISDNLPRPPVQQSSASVDTFSSPAPIKLETYDISDSPIETMFIKHKKPAIIDTTPTVALPQHQEQSSYNENLLSSSNPTQSTTFSQTTTSSVPDQQPESYDYYLHSDSGNRGTHTFVPNSTNSQSQSETQTIPLQIQPTTVTQKGKDKIYYQLLLDEHGNVIKSTNYNFPGQVEYSQVIPGTPTLVLPQFSSTSTDKFNKQQLLDAAKSKTEDSTVIDYNLENTGTLSHFDEAPLFDSDIHIAQVQTGDGDIAVDYSSGATDIQGINLPNNSPSTYHIDNTYNASDLDLINDNSQDTEYPQLNLNTPSNYHIDNTFNTPALQLVDHDSDTITTQSQPFSSNIPPSNYYTDNAYYTPNRITNHWYIEGQKNKHIPATKRYQLHNDQPLYLKTDIANSQIKSNDGLAVDYEIDDYPDNHLTDYNSNLHIPNPQNKANVLALDYNSDGNTLMNIQSDENIAVHHNRVYSQNANNVANQYNQGPGTVNPTYRSKTSVTADRGNTMHVTGDNESSQDDLSVLYDDLNSLENPEDDLMNF